MIAKELVLLPMPRRLESLGGTCNLGARGFIWLAGSGSEDMLRTGKIVRDALAKSGWRGEITAARGSHPGWIGVVVRVDPGQVPKAEGYTLTIRADEIRLVAHDQAGALYGAYTLRQITRQVGESGALPCLRIVDWPDFPNRGVMLDISRDKVPTMETLCALVDTLAEWKINHLQLYTEHTFAYRNHKEVWRNASPISGGEIMELDSYCRDRFVELVPNQNSFGHMERWLAHLTYRSLADEPESPFPMVISPVIPGSIDLIAGLFDELLPHFTSRQFNVGCDEVQLGIGHSCAACEERGAGRVYMEFLLKVHDLVQRHGRTMQFWGDIVTKRPELIPELPSDSVALEWGYGPDHPFAEHGSLFAEAGVPFYVCPGTSSWSSIAGRTDVAMGNIRNAAVNGLAKGAIGLLNTDWGDNGHWQHLPVSYLGFAYGAAMSWDAQANDDINIPHALDLHAFHDAAGVMGRLAYDLGNVYQEPGAIGIWQNSMLNHILMRHPFVEEHISDLTVEGLERSEAYVESVMARLPDARMQRPDSGLVSDEFRNAAALIRHACRHGVARINAVGGHRSSTPWDSWHELRLLRQLPQDEVDEIVEIPSSTRTALADEFEPTIAEYRRLWLARNRPGGLDDSTGRWEAMLAEYRRS